jgi:ubiquinone/menaquinone biosynthesis C-methylase UbiE
MSKPVNKIEFWKERIRTAVKPHYTVYVAHEQLWKNINTSHARIIKKVIPTGSKVLDAGCGYGRMSVLFDNYVGTDFSPDFIELAKKNYPQKEFVQADMKALPFKDKEFDWAFCVSIKKMIIDNLGEDEWLAMEKELTRVAKKVLILEYETPDEFTVLG